MFEDTGSKESMMFEDTGSKESMMFEDTGSKIPIDNSLSKIEEVQPIAKPMKRMATTPKRKIIATMKPASTGGYKPYMCKQGPGGRGLECMMPGKVIF